MKLIPFLPRILLFGWCLTLHAQEPGVGRAVSFKTADAGTVHALLYGRGEPAVVLAHGAAFNKESWERPAKRLATRGFLVLSLDFRGYGRSVAGSKPAALHEDILSAVRYLRDKGSTEIAVVGASMGGSAAARAVIEAGEGEIAKLVLLSPARFRHPEKLKGNLLFIASKEEPLVDQIRTAYEKAPAPKRLELIEGRAHAQHIFKTDQSERLSVVIERFLDGPAAD
jgi:pimeloyl-ACP methyl ester carboxylesterase